MVCFLYRCFYSTLTNRNAWFYIVRLVLIFLYNINLFPYQVKLFLCLKNWSDVCYKAWLIYSANTHRVITCCLCSSDILHLCEGTLTQQRFQSRRFCIAYKILHSILHHSVLSHTFCFSYDCFFFNFFNIHIKNCRTFPNHLICKSISFTLKIILNKPIYFVYLYEN